MNILIVTNLFPPYHHGGYELRCAQVADYLRGAGHRVRVVTSRYRIDGTAHAAAVCEEEASGIHVSRLLRHHRLDPHASAGRLYNLGVVRTQAADIRRFGEILDGFKPHVVNWWNLEGVTKAILRMPADRGIPSMYCIDDGWLINEMGADCRVDSPFWFEFWRTQWGPHMVRPFLRLGLMPVERRLERRGVPTRTFGLPPAHACFISAFRKFQYEQAGMTFRSSEVIYGGVSADTFFVERSPEDFTHGPLRLLYAGYLDRERGLHTVVEALGLLPSEARSRMHLTVVSGGPVIPDAYVNSLQSRVEQLGLAPYVSFLGRVSHDDMPAIYAAHHLLVFPSMRLEGLPMVMMEAMCAGCAVATTGSGGAIELVEQAGAPLFPKDHPFALSRLLVALDQDRRRLAAIALAGQRLVRTEFTLGRMLARTADALLRCVRHDQTRDRTAAIQQVATA